MRKKFFHRQQRRQRLVINGALSMWCVSDLFVFDYRNINEENFYRIHNTHNNNRVRQNGLTLYSSRQFNIAEFAWCIFFTSLLYVRVLDTVQVKKKTQCMKEKFLVNCARLLLIQKGLKCIFIYNTPSNFII